MSGARLSSEKRNRPGLYPLDLPKLNEFKKARERYQNLSKDTLKYTLKRYQNLSEEEEKKQESCHVHYKNLSKDEKQKLVEFRKYYYITLKDNCEVSQ